jgi:hypothetical protein
MAVADNSEPRTYGNWRRPGGGGLFGLGKGATYGGLLWAAAAVFVMIFTGPLVGFGLLVLGLGVIALASVPVFTTGRTVVELVTPRVAHLVAEVTGRSRYRSGPLSGGKFRLPGLATASTLTEAVDAQGRPFAIVTIPKRQHHTIVFTADPDGAALVDQADVDVWVARWGQWLAALGDEPGLVAVSVTVETAPDRGERLRREISATTRPDAPTVAASMLREIAATYPSGSASVRALIAVTFRGVRGRYREDTARDLAGRAAHLASGLHGTGAGAARPMSAAELCETIRTAYDPAAQATFDDARAAGTTAEVAWENVGPVAADASFGSYRHDSAHSITWAMTGAPRGNVPSDVLARLLRPHPEIDRKRVTLLYRPLDSAKAARIVESDHRDAEATVRNAKRPTSRMLTERKSAAATASEEAHGAGLVSFGLLITATAPDADRLAAAKRAVEQLAPTARIRIRPLYGSQEAGFAAGLPLGVVLPAHQRSTRVREGL